MKEEKIKLIKTAEDLDMVNDDPDGYYRIIDHIYTDKTIEIGTEDRPFTGTIDGGGHIIIIPRWGPSSTHFIKHHQGATLLNIVLVSSLQEAFDYVRNSCRARIINLIEKLEVE